MMRALLAVASLSALVALAGPVAKATEVKDSCDEGSAPNHARAKAGAALKTARLVRGDQVPAGTTTTLASLLMNPEAQKGKTVVVEGLVRRACEQKGCWMELAEAKAGPGVRVTFKDYGFFVPTDSAGRTAKVVGLVKVTELSEGMVAHYRSEGATVPTDSQGHSREVQLVASGVELAAAPAQPLTK